jgi:hypothetical protein
MNFGKAGWFDHYLQFRTAQPMANQLPTTGIRLLEGSGLHHEQDQAIYYFLQPTGLMYGFPLVSPFPEQVYPDSRYHDTTARVHLIFLEAMLACMVADRHFQLDGLDGGGDRFGPAAQLTRYYFNNDPTVGRKGWQWFSPYAALMERRLAPNRRFEQIVSGRVALGARLMNVPEYYNSFLFLDLYYGLVWQRDMLIEPRKRHISLGQMAAAKARIKHTLLELQIAAAHASGGVRDPEQRVFDQFLKASGLSMIHQRELSAKMRAGLKLEDVPIPPMPWLVRRFILEAILMVVLVDGVFDDLEREFVNALAAKLELFEDEMGQSQSALEAFLLQQGDRLNLTRAHSQTFRLAERLRERAAAAIRKNLDRLANEVRETHELYALLMKSARSNLTAEEKVKVRLQLMDIMKTIPALAIFALPGGGVILPILIRMLPFNLLPSSFED